MLKRWWKISQSVHTILGNMLRGAMLRGDMSRGNMLRGGMLREDMLRGDMMRGDMKQGHVRATKFCPTNWFQSVRDKMHLHFQYLIECTALANCPAATQKWTTICIVCTNSSTCIVLRQPTPFTRFLKKFPNETIDKEHIQTMLLSRRSENRGFSSCADHLTVLTTCILWLLKAACPCFTFPHFP